MISAPRVNQMRFLSSVALEKTPRLRFAASCSAAEAMERPSSVACYFRTEAEAKQGSPRETAVGRNALRFFALRFGRWLRLRLRHGRRDAAASLLHRLDRSRGRTGYGDRHGSRNLAFCQQPNAVQLASYQPRGLQLGLIDRLRCIQLARCDRGLQRAQIDRCVLLAERIPEAALRQATEDGHLAALEAVHRHAGARQLALHALAGSLALARADAAPESLRLQARARIIAQFVQVHCTFSTFTRWATLWIMPRTEGVSSSSRERRILFSPRPISVSF